MPYSTTSIQSGQPSSCLTMKEEWEFICLNRYKITKHKNYKLTTMKTWPPNTSTFQLAKHLIAKIKSQKHISV